MMLISTNTSNCIIYDMFKFRAQIGSNYHDIMEKQDIWYVIQPIPNNVKHFTLLLRVMIKLFTTREKRLKQESNDVEKGTSWCYQFFCRWTGRGHMEIGYVLHDKTMHSEWQMKRTKVITAYNLSENFILHLYIFIVALASNIQWLDSHCFRYVK